MLHVRCGALTLQYMEIIYLSKIPISMKIRDEKIISSEPWYGSMLSVSLGEVQLAYERLLVSGR